MLDVQRLLAIYRSSTFFSNQGRVAESGLRHSTRNRAWGNPPWVRIPPLPRLFLRVASRAPSSRAASESNSPRRRIQPDSEIAVASEAFNVTLVTSLLLLYEHVLSLLFS